MTLILKPKTVDQMTQKLVEVRAIDVIIRFGKIIDRLEYFCSYEAITLGGVYSETLCSEKPFSLELLNKQKKELIESDMDVKLEKIE